MEANLLHDIRNVWTREHQILQCTGNASVGSGVVDELAVGCGWLWLGVCWCSNSIAVLHAGTLKYVLGVLGLREEEAMLMMSHANAKEVAHRPHVLHGEGVMESLDDVLEKTRGGRRHDHVIHVQ